MRISGRLEAFDRSLAAFIGSDHELARSSLVRVYGPTPSQPLEELLDALDLFERGEKSRLDVAELYAAHRRILVALLAIAAAVEHPDEP
jgi:hypothetical protein